jgi:dihydroneopterin aldolase
MDTVFLRSIRLEASIGVFPWEKEIRQPLEVDVEAEVDTTELLATGNLAVGVDFGVVIDTVRAVVLKEHIDLVEVAADRIARALLDATPASRIRVEVRKYTACAAYADHVGVVVKRERENA